MKKTGLLLALAFSGLAASSQTLFTYGGISVDKDEFLRAYNKNKTPVNDKEKSLREYLELYTRFKLKVKAAQEMHLDTLPQIKYDLEGFRTQIEGNYLNNEKAMNTLVDEAFSRSQKDLHILHFFVPVNSEVMSPADTVLAWKAINEAVAAGKSSNNWSSIAEAVSAKTFKMRGSDIGFVTAFSLPYEYENTIYNLGVGETSKPRRNKNGIHAFKLVEERKSAGRWRIAQIMLSLPPGDTVQNMAQLKEKANTIYSKLQSGEDFSEMAKSYSDDKMTYMVGGEMPEFGTGKYEMAFENEVFKLKKDGEIGKPFASPYGYHIIKRLAYTPTPSDKNETAYQYDLKQKIQGDSRIVSAREAFNQEVIRLVGYKKNTAVKDADVYRYADSAALHYDTDVNSYPISNKPIFSFGKTGVTGAEWLTFARNLKTNAELYKGEGNASVMDKFIASAAMDYYKKHLEEYNTEFRYQMDEFREGNILFEIMERNVWSSAAQDVDGLKKYYEANKSKYQWAPSASLLIFSCSNKTVATQAIAALQAGKDWRKIVEEGGANIQADSGRYELAQVPIGIDPKSPAGTITPPAVNAVDGSTSFAKVLQVFNGGMQRSFEEARGLVINDYQTLLEDQWVAQLKKKYPIVINESVFKSLLK